MLQLTPKKEIKLRPYQLQAVEGLREGIRTGISRQILVAPTGAGKTVIASHLLRQADQKGKYALFLVDRVALVKQTSGTLDDYGIPHGIVQGINERWHPYENVQVCSIQTLARRSLPRRPELIIYDEAHCFVAGTLVETPNGPRPIEEVAVGDEVYTAIGVGCVRHTFCNPANELVRVNFDDGTSVVCTPDHRFLTGDAWVQARLMDGQSAFGVEDMSGLWKCLSSEDIQDSGGQLAGRTRGVLDQAPLLLAKLCEEVEEPDAPSSIAGAHGDDPSQHWSQTQRYGRQRTRDDRAAATAIAETWRRLDCGVDGEHRHPPGQRDPGALENRHSQSRTDDSRGSGWQQSRQHEGAGEGRTQGRVSGLKRVVSVQGVECAGGRAVYNLEVSGHPSYFADGVLVHNCQYKATLDFIADHPDATTIGLTATPFTAGMAAHWGGMVNVTTTRALIDEKFLVEPKIYVAKSPDDKEFSLSGFGEFTDESASAAGTRIVGDVVQEWIGKTFEHFGGPAKTIVFSPTVEHGRELCAAFSAAGYNFQQISYLDRSEDERAAKIAEFRRPDSIIHGLVSCGVLTKGFDVADVRIGIEAALSALNIDESTFYRYGTTKTAAFADSGMATVATINAPASVKIGIRFDMSNPRAEAWIRDNVGGAITRLTNETRDGVRAAILEGYQAGRHPNDIARDIGGRVIAGKRQGGILGLSGPQMGHVSTMRSRLTSGDPAEMAKVFEMQRRDRRFDGIIRQAIENGKPLAKADIDQISRRYSDRLLALRAENIARTETASAVMSARSEEWAQACEKLGRPPESIIKTWRHGGGVKDPRPWHQRANNMQVRGLHTPFVLSNGARMQFACDPAGGAKECANCTCDTTFRLDHTWGLT